MFVRDLDDAGEDGKTIFVNVFQIVRLMPAERRKKSPQHPHSLADVPALYRTQFTIHSAFVHDLDTKRSAATAADAIGSCGRMREEYQRASA